MDAKVPRFYGTAQFGTPTHGNMIETSIFVQHDSSTTIMANDHVLHIESYETVLSHAEVGCMFQRQLQQAKETH